MNKFIIFSLFLPNILFAHLDEYRAKGKFPSDALLIIHNNKVVFEEYIEPYHKDKKHLLWSVSKSILQILVGIALDNNRLSLSDNLCKYFPDLNDKKCKITIRHLLEWTSGLNWSETYEESMAESSVVSMLYTENKMGITPFILSHPAIKAPGTRWYYSSGDTNLLAAILAKVYYDKPFYPFELLFDPLGITNVTFETDLKGVYIGSSYLYMTARDLAKIGKLYLNSGRYKNQQFISSDWVKFSRELVPAFKRNPMREDDNDIPGHHWWLNKSIESKGIQRPWPALSSQAFAARGHWGQYLIVDPVNSLIIVRFGNDRDKSVDLAKFTQSIMKYIKGRR